MTGKKKTWTEPELIVLVRGKPEEAILGSCKSQIYPIGPGTPAHCSDGDGCATSGGS